MTRPSPEDLLRELGREDPDHRDRVPSDAMLEAWRRGELDSDQMREIQALLCDSAAARARLVHLAGLDASGPVGRVRDRVLGADSRPRARHHAPRWWRGAAAAAIVVLLAPVASRLVERCGGRQESIAAAPRALEFDVRVEGLARIRSVADLSEALPDTVIRVTVEPVQDAAAGLTFAVYRRQDGVLRRLGPDDGVEIATWRGSAAITASAATLVGASPGTREFFVVVVAGKDLPESVPIVSGDAAADLQVGTGGRVWRRTLTVLDADAVPGRPESEERR